MFKRKLRLPVTLDEFDLLVAKVVKKYKLKDAHHAAAIISIAIRHLPNDKAYTTYDYLGHTVLKNIANYVANHKAELLKHSSQVEQLVNMLKEDPGNIQARDELQKAANDGSDLAKKALDELNLEDNALAAQALN